MYSKKELSRIAVTVLFSAVFIFILSVSQISAEPYVHYHLDGNGTDAGSNGLDLTVNEDQLTWVEGINGQAAFIKEGNNFNPLSMNEMYGSGDWTFEAWVKFENFDITSSNRCVYIMDAGSFDFGYGCPSYKSIVFSASINLNYYLSYSFIGRWFHIAGVYRDGQSIQLFINGEKVGDEVPSYNLNFFKNHHFYIGRLKSRSYTREFTIDEVVIHNAALNPEDFIGMQYNVEYPLYAINGNITDSSSGEGLPGAVVTADPGEFVVATDSNGDFTIDLPWDGEFTISVNKSNYTSTSPQNIVVVSDVPATINFALERFPTSPTIACYHFDGDGTDASGNGYDFIVDEKVTWTDGIQGKAAVFDSTETISFETCKNGLIYPGSGDFTFEGLVYTHVPESGYPVLYLKNYSYTLYIYKHYYYGKWQIDVILQNFNERFKLSLPFTDYLNEWVHVAFVYRYQQSLQLYINGELVAEEETDFIPDIFPKEKFVIYASKGPYLIDELRISNTALSPEQFLFMETSVEDPSALSAFSITGNFPNPFNPSTTIEFTIPETGHINLSIYNITGQKIRELAAGTMTAGTHSIVWDGKDEKGIMVSSGIYMSRLKSGEHFTAGRMLLMK